MPAPLDPSQLVISRRDHVDGAEATALVVEGEIDVATVGELVRALEAALQRRGDRVTVDLSGVAFCDSTALAALVRCRRRAFRLGGALTVSVDREAPVGRLIELAGLARVFELPSARPADAGRR